jgi:hypothetical protein
MMCIQQQQKIAVVDGLAAGAAALDCSAGKIDTEATRELLIPVVLGHLTTVRSQPENLL